MPNLNVTVPHSLSQDQALRRIKDAITQAKSQHSGNVNELQENWNGNVGTFSGAAMGQTASGSITVNPSDIVFDLVLPFAAILFKSKIEQGIREFASKLLA